MKGKTLNSLDIERIKNIIEQHESHLNRSELATLAGVSETTIRRVQQGKYKTKFSKNDCLCDVLKSRGLCDNDIKIVISLVERLKCRGK